MEIINCGFFLLPKLTKKYWYFVWFLVGSFCRVFIPYILDIINYEKNNNDNLKILLTQNYFEIIRNISSDVLVGIFHLIYIIRNKNQYKKMNQYQYNTKTNLKFIKNNTIINHNMIKLIFIISFVDIICQLSIPIKYIIESRTDKPFLTKSPDHLNSFLFIDIISRYIFSLCILRTYFYAHHYLAFFLIFISMSLLFMIDVMFKYYGNYDILYTIIIGLKYVLYSFEDIMNKVAFTTIYIMPQTLIFYKGLFELIIYLPIITIIFFVFHLHDFKDLKDYLIHELKYFIAFVPFNILRTIFLVDVIDRFSAQHMSFLKVSEALILFLFYLIINIEEDFFHLSFWAYIVQIVAFVILLISTLIHNEIIIINLPKLKAKTEYYLNKDADREQNTSYYSDTFFSQISDNSASNLYSDLTGSDMS